MPWVRWCFTPAFLWGSVALFAVYFLVMPARWPEFYAAARALLDGRPITVIPIMRHVAPQTVAAFADRRQGS